MVAQIDKAKQREIMARRRTNLAIQRIKLAQKKAYYIRHKFSALADKLFINGLVLERTLRRLTTVRNLYRKNKDLYIYTDRQNSRLETFEERITSLEVLELEYNSDSTVLASKREMILQQLEDQEERLAIANEEKKILENRLLKSSDALRLKQMKRDLDNERRDSRAGLLDQRKGYLQEAKARYRTAIDRIECLTNILRRIVANLEEQRDITRKTNRELQHTKRLRQNSVPTTV